MCAQPFTDGIPPNIAGDVFDAFGRPKNVVVVAHFPERAAVGFAKLKGRALFEQADEFEKIAAVMDAFHKDMKMVGHEAEGVQQEGVTDYAFHQKGNHALSRGGYVEIGHAVVTAGGEETCLTPEIVSRQEASGPAMDGHTRR